jgi:pyridoxine kinase
MSAIITMSSHVAYGAVGNRIMVPAIEALGISAIAMSTVQLPWHPGMNKAFGSGTRIVPDDTSFAAMVMNLQSAPWLGEISGIITGYLGSPGQAEIIAELINALKRANPAALYLCDPVIGDTGGLYVPEVTAASIRQHLWPIADIVTPNLFEFGWMTGSDAVNLNEIASDAKSCGKRHVVVTSVAAGPNRIGNLLVSNDNVSLISHRTLSPTPNGTGDMLAALFLSNLIKGESADQALRLAASAVVEAIRHANQHDKASLSPENLRDAAVQNNLDIHLERI